MLQNRPIRQLRDSTPASTVMLPSPTVMLLRRRRCRDSSSYPMPVGNAFTARSTARGESSEVTIADVGSMRIAWPFVPSRFAVRATVPEKPAPLMSDDAER